MPQRNSYAMIGMILCTILLAAAAGCTYSSKSSNGTTEVHISSYSWRWCNGEFSCTEEGAAAVAGSGNLSTITLNPGPFHAVDAGCPADVILRQGPVPGVTITGDDNIIPLYYAEVVGGILELRCRGSYSSLKKPITIYVTSPSYDSVSVSGSGHLTSDQTISADTFVLSVSGSGSASIPVRVRKLTTGIEGSGSATLTGTAVSHDAVISGSGDLIAPGLEAESVSLTINGSGNAEINAKDQLALTITGSGNAICHGSPRIRSMSVSGSGNVRME